MKKAVVFLGLLTILLTGCSQKTATGGFLPAEGLIVAGSVECDTLDLNAKIPGKIEAVYFNEGDVVTSGAVIAKIQCDELLAKQDQLKAKVKMAEQAIELQEAVSAANVTQAGGAYEAAAAQLAKAENGARSQELEQARVYYELMAATAARVEKIYEKGGVSAQKRDEVRAQLNMAQQQYEMAEEGARSEDIAAAVGILEKAEGALSAANASALQVSIAQEQYNEAQAGLEEVNSYLQDTKIMAAQGGTLTSVNVLAGELVSSGMPIATVVDLKQPYVLLPVLESDLDQVFVQQQVQVRVLADLEKTLSGKVVSISAQPSFAVKKAVNNLESDLVSYDVKVVLDDLQETKVYPGMTAYVLFPAEEA